MNGIAYVGGQALCYCGYKSIWWEDGVYEVFLKDENQWAQIKVSQ